MKTYNIIERPMNEIDPITLLAHKCYEARKASEAARIEQLKLEAELLAMPGINQYLKDSGSTSFMGGFLKIQTKINQRWNQDKIIEVMQDTEFPVNPFDIEYKANNANIKLLKDYHPDLYRKISIALTEMPAKPYFNFAGE